MQARLANKDLRDAIKKYGIRMWEMAEVWGISDSKLTRALRHEFNKEQMESAVKAINVILEARKKAAEEKLKGSTDS
jgi:hypothetical protein